MNTTTATSLATHIAPDATASKPLVQFLVGGVQKAGTTALHDLLSQHPQIHMPSRKELHYFDKDAHFSQSLSDYAHYHQLFAEHSAGQMCGEATPSYVYVKPVMQRVKAYNPQMKWIVLLRHPAHRAYSHWNMQKSRGIEPLSFEEAIQAEPERMTSLPIAQRHKFAYLARGHYAEQIQRLLEHYDRQQCLFLTNDAIRNDFADSLAKLCDFLELEHAALRQHISHEGRYTRSIENQTLKSLCEHFAQDIAATAELTGLDLRDWRG